jgi:hypothetical protein
MSQVRIVGTWVAESLVEADGLGPVLAGLVGVANVVHIIAEPEEGF